MPSIETPWIYATCVADPCLTKGGYRYREIRRLGGRVQRKRRDDPLWVIIRLPNNAWNREWARNVLVERHAAKLEWGATGDYFFP